MMCGGRGRTRLAEFAKGEAAGARCVVDDVEFCQIWWPWPEKLSGPECTGATLELAPELFTGGKPMVTCVGCALELKAVAFAPCWLPVCGPNGRKPVVACVDDAPAEDPVTGGAGLAFCSAKCGCGADVLAGWLVVCCGAGACDG